MFQSLGSWFRYACYLWAWGSSPRGRSKFWNRFLDPRFAFAVRIHRSWVWISMTHGSMFHVPKGSSSRLHGNFRFQAPSHRSSFLILNWHPWSWIESQPAFENLRQNLWLNNWIFTLILFGLFRWFQVILGGSRSSQVVLDSFRGHFRLC